MPPMLLLAAVNPDTPASFVTAMNNYAVDTLGADNEAQDIAQRIITSFDTSEDFSHGLIQYLTTANGLESMKRIIFDNDVLATIQHPIYGGDYASIEDMVKHYAEELWVNLSEEKNIHDTLREQLVTYNPPLEFFTRAA